MIENLYDLRQKVFDALELQAQIVETQGQDLDIGEHFKVRFTVTHRLYDPATSWYAGTVTFLDCKLGLEATPFAKPVATTPAVIPLGTLWYVGQSLQTTVEFEAIAKMPNLIIPSHGIYINPPEQYVKARVYARFDIEGFFNFYQEKIFFTQIESG
jgi:hypothetical protein